MNFIVMIAVYVLLSTKLLSLTELLFLTAFYLLSHIATAIITDLWDFVIECKDTVSDWLSRSKKKSNSFGIDF